jgi:peptidyl-prolyl cis-trans isomerase SurA
MYRTLFLSRLAATVLGAFLLLPSLSYAQVNEQLKATTVDEKIRDIDGVAAVVNTGFITRKEIDDRVAALKAKDPKLADAPDLRKRVLEQIIIEKVQLQNAELEGISVSDKELNQIIAGIAAQNKLSMSDFKAKVTQSGTSYERYRQLLREDVIVSRYREREIEGKIKISDAEIDNFIAEQNRAYSGSTSSQSSPAVNGGPEEINVAQIFIPVDSKAGEGAKAQAKKKADLLLREARGDIDFLQLGSMAAKDDPAIKFQALGYRPPERLPQLFFEAIRNTGSGQVAGAVVKSPAGYHVLKVLDRRALSVSAPSLQQQSAEEVATTTPKNIMVTQTMARHILLRNREGLTDQDAQRRLAGYRDQVRAKTADFGDLAKKYSEDGSAKNGGNLGWMGPGDLVPEFDQAMNRLQIGDVSDPVKTQFGWHLIQVLERRQAELTNEKQKQFARAAIRERKFEQAYQDWIRELRDTATVKIINADDPASTPR